MPGNASPSRLSGRRKKWLVVVASFCILFVVKGTVATYGVFISPIEADFGWSRTTISLTFSIYLVATAIGSPVAGNLIDRYGPHRTLPVYIAVVALSLVALSVISTLTHLYLLYGMVGLSITGLANSHFSSIITKWFDSRTMLASGIVISGFSLGRLVFNPLAAELILRFDWRVAYLVFGLLSMVTIPVAYFLVKQPDESTGDDAESITNSKSTGDDAESITNGESADDDEESTAEERRTDGGDADTTTPSDDSQPLSAALRSPSLWLLVATFAICGFTTVGLMTTHFVPYLLTIGFSESVAAQGAGVLGGMTVFGLIGMGVVGDRYDSRKRGLLASIYVLRAVTLFFLVLVTTVAGMFVFATVYGFLTLCTVPLHASITADVFGRRHLTTLVGVQFTGHQLGGASAALAAGWIFDTMGSYRFAHLLGVGLLLLTPLFVLGERALGSIRATRTA